MALVASSASPMTPRPAEPTVLPLEGPGPRRGRWLFAMMMAVKAARLLHQGPAEPIAGRDGFIGVLGGFVGYAARPFDREVALSSM